MTLVPSRFAVPILTALFLVPNALPQAPTDTARTQDSEPTSAVVPSISVPTPVFVEIQLTNEGVVAYDSAGDRWVYDFEDLRFVRSEAPTGESGLSERGDAGEQVEPVESRCTEEKIVDYPALNAVYVGQDEYVNGDIKAYSRVTVKGWVKGNVQSFNKTVLVTSTGQVDGDVRAPEVEIKEGGLVKGAIIETPPYEIPVDAIRTGFSTAGIWVVFGFTLGLSLMIFLISALAPSRARNAVACVAEFPLKSTLIGLLFVLLSPVIVVLVVLTVIGVLIVWAVPLAYFVAYALGVMATSALVLSAFRGRAGEGRVGLPLASVVGIAFHMGLWALVAVNFNSESGGTADALLLLAILTSCFPVLAGTGAVVLTRFGSRSYHPRQRPTHQVSEPAPAPAPPPIPQPPPKVSRPALDPMPGPLPSDSSDTPV